MRQTLFLLGGFGFIATNVLKYIDSHYVDKYDVITFDRLEKHPFGVQFDCVKASYAGDFSDETQIEQIFKTHKIDTVLHFLSNTVPATSSNSLVDYFKRCRYINQGDPCRSVLISGQHKSAVVKKIIRVNPRIDK